MSKKKKKRKSIKSNTLAGLWKNINSVAPAYIDCDKKDAEDYVKKINKIIDEANDSLVPSSIASLFISPYMHKDNCTLEFSGEEKNSFGKWAVKYNDDESRMQLDPIGLHKYVSDFKNAEYRLNDEITLKDDFKKHRQVSFMKALSKLPEPYFFYIVVLQEIARLNDIVSVENREGGYTKSDSSSYLSTLWAFKEFERFYLRVQHRHLRADYGIIWHEGEWVEDRRTKGYS